MDVMGKGMIAMAYYAEVRGIPAEGSEAAELELSPYWWSVDALRRDARVRPAYTPGYNDSAGFLRQEELLKLNDEMIQMRGGRGVPVQPNVAAAMEAFQVILRDRGHEFARFLVTVREWESGLSW